MVLECIWYITEEPIDRIWSTRNSRYGLWAKQPDIAGTLASQARLRAGRAVVCNAEVFESIFCLAGPS
jgi:hypothetical protein